MLEQLFQMIENSSDAYVIFEAATKEIVYKNKLAEKHFILTEERANKDFFERIEAQFERREIAVFPNTPMRSAQDTTIYCNVEGGYLDEEKKNIWGKITPITADLNAKRVLEPRDSDIIYLEAIPRLYQDVLFRLDPKTKTVTHAGDLVLQFGLPRVLKHFPECLLESESIHPDDVQDYMDYAYGMLKGIAGSIICRIKLIDKTYEWFSVETTAIRDMNGELLEMMGKMSNIHHSKKLEEASNFDALTNTLTKVAFENKVSEVLGKEAGAMLFVDVDNFKQANDSYGHTFGDELIAEIGARLNHCVRESDFVGRVGGDEFMIYLQNINDLETVERKVRQILSTMCKPIEGNQGSHTLTVSVGIARYPHDADSYEVLYSAADKALYHSKEKGKNVATFYAENSAQYKVITMQQENHMYNNALEMLDRSICAFIVFHKETHEVVSENKKARDLFYNEENQLDVNYVFGSADNVSDIIKKVEAELAEKLQVCIKGVPTMQSNGQKVNCDLEFSYISDDRNYVYLKLTPKNDKKITLMKSLIEKTKHPVVVLNKDSELSISYANSYFYADFNSTEETFAQNYGKALNDLFLPHQREEFMALVMRGMDQRSQGCFKVPLEFSTGEQRYFSFDSDKLKTMDSSEKIYCELVKSLDQLKN